MSRLSEYHESIFQEPPSSVEEYIRRQQEALGGGEGVPARPPTTGLSPMQPFPPSPGFTKENPTVVVIDETHVRVNGQLMTIDEARRKFANDPVTQGALNEATTRSTQSTSATTTARRGTETLTGTERRYIDVPTPEQFLDDFRNGFATHVRGLRLGGGLDVSAASWLLDNIDIFWSEYLGRLGEMAQKGEQVFRPTAVSPEVTPLGTRPGEVSAVRQQLDTATQSAGTTTKAQTEQAEAGVGGTVQEVGSATVKATENAVESEAFKQDMTKTSQIDEEVVARPDIGVVHTLSPLDFLGQQFPASSLKIIYEGRRAQRAAQARVGGPVSARRVG